MKRSGLDRISKEQKVLKAGEGIVSEKRSGAFVTFEGIEGCGKTSQITMLGEHLIKKGYSVLMTREPGGTPVGESVREILLHAGNSSMRSLTELFLLEAVRHQHVDEVIVPSLQDGKVVLCDRFSDATTAYQGFGRGIDREMIELINHWSTGGLKPNLTILLDCPVEEGIDRSLDRLRKEGKLEGESRFEKEGLEFHTRVREGYLEIAGEEPDRFRLLSATPPPEKIHKEVVEIVDRWLESHDF